MCEIQKLVGVEERRGAWNLRTLSLTMHIYFNPLCLPFLYVSDRTKCFKTPYNGSKSP